MEHLPLLAQHVETMVDEHDVICRALMRTCSLAATNTGLTEIAASFEQFVEAYVSHATEEATFLEELSIRLDGFQRERLARVVEGL